MVRGKVHGKHFESVERIGVVADSGAVFPPHVLKKALEKTALNSGFPKVARLIWFKIA